MNSEAGSLTRILFVDDSKVMLKTASKILSAEFDAITAVDGDDAWAKLERDHEIQVLFTDINMPGTDGYGLLQKVRAADDPGLHDMPVIMITGADDDEAAKQQALDRGATDFLNKKYISTELLTRARAHAKYQRMSRQMHEQATLDELTGLSNEHGFLIRLEQDIAYALRHKQDWALLRVEIDEIAGIAQAAGQAVADELVRYVAGLLGKRIRKEDTAARIGLGGFAVSAPGGHCEGIAAMAAGLQAVVAQHSMDLGGRRIVLGLSAGVVGAEPGVWSSAQEGLDRCQAVLERNRQDAAEQAARVEAEAAARREAEAAEAARREAEAARKAAAKAALAAAEAAARREAEAEQAARREAEAAKKAAAEAAARREAEAAQRAAAEAARKRTESEAVSRREAEAAQQRAAAAAASRREAEAAQRAAADAAARRDAGRTRKGKAHVPEPVPALPGLLGRMLAAVRSFGARLARFFQKPGGK